MRSAVQVRSAAPKSFRFPKRLFSCRADYVRILRLRLRKCRRFAPRAAAPKKYYRFCGSTFLLYDCKFEPPPNTYQEVRSSRNFLKQCSALFYFCEMSKRIMQGVCGDRGNGIFHTVAERCRRFKSAFFGYAYESVVASLLAQQLQKNALPFRMVRFLLYYCKYEQHIILFQKPFYEFVVKLTVRLIPHR